MTAEAADAGARSTPGADRDSAIQELAAGLRRSASRAAELADGGLAVVFAWDLDDPSRSTPPRLRAAAGFIDAAAARDGAMALAPHANECLRGGAVHPLEPIPALGERAAAGVLMYPLTCGERVYGVLAVGSPQSIEGAARHALTELAAHAGLRFEHSRVASELAEIQHRLIAPREEPADQSEEILKLSEALFAQDIELLRNNEKLGKIEKLKNDFIEKMSRELRTPLNSIIEAIILVLTTENEALSESSKETLRSSLDEGTAFLRTLQNILDLWRIKQNELPVEIQDINFRETVDEAIFSVQDGIDEKQLVVEPVFEEPFPKIRTDLTKLSQILFLVLDNAVKFTTQGKVQISARVTDSRLICDVTDTGVGICTDDQQFIFDEFYQVDESASQRYTGAGLGLTLVRDLVVLLEGEVAVSSEISRGTTVTFQIPIQVVG